MDKALLTCNDPLPDALAERLQTLAQLERRTESLRDELAVLHVLLMRVVQHTDSPDADRHELRGAETILIADDQVLVRAITQGILEGFGYNVLVSDADLHGWACDARIDLVLFDMPALAERGFLRLQQARERGVPIIVSTPLPQGPGRQELRQAGAAAFIAKPIHPLELARCIRDVLAS